MNPLSSEGMSVNQSPLNRQPTPKSASFSDQTAMKVSEIAKIGPVERKESEQPNSFITISKEEIKNISPLSESEETRKKFNLGQFITNILENIKKALSHLNFFAYFRKSKPQDASISQPLEVNAKNRINPERLSAVSQHLAKLLLADNEKNLDEEGIFRLSALKSEKDALFKVLTDRDYKEYPILPNNPILIAALFKEVYKQLDLYGEEKLATQLHLIGMGLKGETDRTKIVKDLKDLVQLLSEDRQKDLKTFIEVLYRTSKHEQQNKMSPNNMAIAAGINILASAELEYFASRQTIALLFITHYEEVFQNIS